jgi:hypothetical protein
MLYPQADKASEHRSVTIGSMMLIEIKLSLSTAFYWVEIVLITSPYSPATQTSGHAQSTTFMLDAYVGDAFDFHAPHWARTLRHMEQQFRISRQELSHFLRRYSRCLPDTTYLVSPIIHA